jgi:hypothetical protein
MDFLGIYDDYWLKTGAMMYPICVIYRNHYRYHHLNAGSITVGITFLLRFIMDNCRNCQLYWADVGPQHLTGNHLVLK